MSNVQNPKQFNVTPPATAVAGAAVDDYTISYALAPGNVAPVGFPVGAPGVVVPKADIVNPVGGPYTVPFPDLALSTLVPGTYVAEAVSTSSQAGTQSSPSNFVFFDVLPPKPNPPTLSVS